MIKPTDDQAAALAAAARRLAGYSMSDLPKRSSLMRAAIYGICQFDCTSSESESLIRSAISPNLSAADRNKSVRWAIFNMKQLVRDNPKLAAEIYETVFDNPVDSDEVTPLGGGRIIPMTSTLKQDYKSSRYDLGKAFPDFLNASPLDAIPVLCQVLANENDVEPRPGVPRLTFDFRGRSIVLAGDASSLYRGSSHRQHDPHVMMLNAFVDFVEDLVKQDKREELDKVLDHLSDQCPPAELWSRLLETGAAYPELLGVRLAEMLASPAILVDPDTRRGALNCIAAVYPLLPSGERESIEVTIQSIPNLDVLEHLFDREVKRDRLLLCLDESCLVLAETSEAIATAKTNAPAPEQQTLVEPDDSFDGFRVDRLDAADIRRLYGDQIGASPVDANAEVIAEALLPVRRFSQQFLNGAPATELIDVAQQAIESAEQAIAAAGTETIDSDVIEAAFGAIAQAYKVILRNETIFENQMLLSNAETAILRASKTASPVGSTEENESFDDSPRWESGAPRFEAAQALMSLARKSPGATPDVIQAIDEASRDEVNCIRYEIARHLKYLYQTANDEMWDLATQFATSDQSTAVTHNLVREFLHYLLPHDEPRVIELATTLFERASSGDGWEKVRCACIDLFRDAYLHRNNEDAGEIVFAVAGKLTDHIGEAHFVINGLRSLIKGLHTNGDRIPQDVLERTWRLFNHYMASAMEAFPRLNEEYGDTPSESIPPSYIEAWKQLAQLLDAGVTELYFGSGASDRSSNNQRRVLTHPQPDQFWQNVQPSLDILECVYIPSAVHHLVEMFAGYVDVDPPNVFRRLGRTIVASQEGGYQHESLAVGLVVKIVERYLAEFPETFRENADCRELLMKLLDLFIGWPDAHGLVFRLDDIYR